MKLHELGAQRQTEQIAKAIQKYMGNKVNFESLDVQQTNTLLGKVQGLLKEYKTSVSRHYSERNPDYLKLVMMEQALKVRLNEQGTVTPAVASGVDAKKVAALQTAQMQQKKRQIQDQIKLKQKEIQDLQRIASDPTMSMVAEKYMGFKKTAAAVKKGGSARDPEAVAAAIGRKKYGKEKFQKAAAAGKKLKEGRRLTEGELQTAQVVMASQDMVDKIQKMLEQISEMQFKDLPSIADAIKNDMGVDQSTRFQADAGAALSQLLNSVQQGKTQLEAAQGVLTGQAPTVPGQTDDMGAGMPSDAGTDIDADLSLDANIPAPEPEEDEELSSDTLGRERR